MSVSRETTAARRRLEFMLRACVRFLARPGTTDKEIRAAIEHLLARVGPTETGTPDVLAELVRRGEHVPHDGYPPQSMADSDIHGGFAQATPTEKRALRLATNDDEQPDDWRETTRDTAADALRELVTNISAAASFLGDADTNRRFLLSIQWRQKDEEPVDTCSLDGTVVTKLGADRIKGGYCPACYEAWRRAGAPRDPVERSQFERERLAKLQVRARAECEHVCCPVDERRSVDHKHFHEPDTCPSCAEVRSAEAS